MPILETDHNLVMKRYGNKLSFVPILEPVTSNASDNEATDM